MPCFTYHFMSPFKKDGGNLIPANWWPPLLPGAAELWRWELCCARSWQELPLHPLRHVLTRCCGCPRDPLGFSERRGSCRGSLMGTILGSTSLCHSLPFIPLTLKHKIQKSILLNCFAASIPALWHSEPRGNFPNGDHAYRVKRKPGRGEQKVVTHSYFCAIFINYFVFTYSKFIVFILLYYILMY